MTLRFALARGLADVLGTLLHEAARATGTIRAWTGLRPLRAAPVRGILVAGLDFVPIVARIRDWPWTDAKRVPCGRCLTATLVRLLLGAGLAVTFSQSGMTLNPLNGGYDRCSNASDH